MLKDSAHRYSVTSQNGLFFLAMDGKMSACPFTPPLLVQARIAGKESQVQRLPCSTQCPLAELGKIADKDGNERHVYITNCGFAEVMYDVTPDEVPAEGAPKKGQSLIQTEV